ncbi:unnamed protein product, partial [Mesorhabditis spiculigera]
MVMLLNRPMSKCHSIQLAQILEDERAEGPVQNNLGASFIRSCVCRPGNPDEPLKTSRLVEERLTLLALTLVNYSNTVPEHWKLLCELYRRATKSLTGESQECARIGGHWERIGFQGADPSTDFRSAGMLGLIQLHFFCTESVSDDILKEILTLSQDSVQNFPLAVVGINFTAQIIERLKKRMLNAISNSFESVFQTISLIYRGCLFEFCNRWRLNNCTIIDFHSNLTAIGRMMDKDPACLITVKYLPKFEQ